MHTARHSLYSGRLKIRLRPVASAAAVAWGKQDGQLSCTRPIEIPFWLDRWPKPLVRWKNGAPFRLAIALSPTEPN
ncbi:polypeptide-transport-associated domain-containing protein [Anopheles sinensis]|uniref:Polypeptide-transport-associated domain-containing protein n=1 Tax=Anopheles sinensis TaxID=74873 RepID=A0A084WHT7_ANOSI|nr:polypeptide-transport-associated domain-containing protein [Anopheles sinensis]